MSERLSVERERMFNGIGLMPWQRSVARMMLSGDRSVLSMPRMWGKALVERTVRDAREMMDAVLAEREVRAIVASQRRRRGR